MKKFEIKSPEAKGEIEMNGLPVVKYDIVKADIEKMKTDFMNLKINGVEDKIGYNKVHESRMVVAQKRIAVERRRKEFKSGILAYGREVDNRAKEIFSALAPIEDYLKSEEIKIDEEKERIKEEKRKAQEERMQKRVDALAAIDTHTALTVLNDLSDEEFEIHLADATQIYEQKKAEEAERERIAKEKEEAEKKAQEEEKARLAKIKAEQDAKEKKLKEEEERIKKEQEAEKAKLKAEQDRIKKEQEAEAEKVKKDQEAREAKIKAAQDKLDAEKREAERQEELRQAKLKAAAQAIKDKEEKEKRDAEEKARQEALKPDKEKLFVFADKLRSTKGPDVKSKKAQKLLDGAIIKIFDIGNHIINELEKL